MTGGVVLKGFSRFYELRERLFRLIRYVDEGYHKSYEGALDVTFMFPNIYKSNENPEPAEQVNIELHCYLLCNGRHETFRGDSFEKCMDEFERWIETRERNIHDYDN